MDRQKVTQYGSATPPPIEEKVTCPSGTGNCGEDETEWDGKVSEPSIKKSVSKRKSSGPRTPSPVQKTEQPSSRVQVENSSASSVDGETTQSRFPWEFDN